MLACFPTSNGQVMPECTDKPGIKDPWLDVLSARSTSVLLPLPRWKAEPAILSAWAVLLKVYYSINPVSSRRVGSTGTYQSPCQAGKSGSISVDFQSEWSLADLQAVIFQRIDSSSTSAQGSSGDSERYAVWVANEQGIPLDEHRQEILDLTNASEVCLLLVAQRIEEDSFALSLYSHRDRPCQFELSSLLDSLRRVLDSFVYRPYKLVNDVEVISNYDLLRLRGWMEVDPPKPATTVHGLVNRHYRERPAHIAISTTSKDVTYEELGKRSGAMARELLNYGIGPGNIVGFCMEKSALSLIVLLAILRAGAGYVPIATSNPVDRMEYITRKAGVQALVAESAVLERLKDHSSFHELPMVTPSSLDKVEALSHGWSQELEVDPSQVVYIMFTSGSTGQPKGIVHQHDAVSGGLEAVCQSFGLDSSTRFLQFASFSFDASICGLFAPWVAGGTVCVPSEVQRIGELEGVMHELNVTDASLTPTIVMSLKPEMLPTLRHLYIGGEAPTATVLSTWADKVRLSNI